MLYSQNHIGCLQERRLNSQKARRTDQWSRWSRHAGRRRVANLAVVAALLVIGAAGRTVHAQGPLVSWGNDDCGQVSGTPAGTFVAVAAGDFHSVAIRTDGTLVSWGCDSDGVVSDTPVGTFTAVAAAGFHSVAIRTDGALVSWGDDSSGQVSGVPTGAFTAVAASKYFDVAIRTDGTLVSWGSPPAVPPVGTYSAVAASALDLGLGTGVAIRTDGTLVSWGNAGLLDPLAAPPSGTFSAVAVNSWTTEGVAIRTDGTLVSWNLRDGSLRTPQPGTFSAVAVGHSSCCSLDAHFVAIRTDGTLVSWGDDFYGQVSSTPAGTFSAVATGGIHSVAIAESVGNQPPVITCNDPVVLWSPNHELVDAGSAFSVDDPDGDPVDVSIRVFSDETEIPDTGDGTGQHAPDYKTQLASGAVGHFLRSERRGTEDGRFYIGVITADDGNGGVTEQVCVLGVCPHDQNDPASLDDVLNHADAAAAAVDFPAGLNEHGLSDPLGPNQ